MNRPRGILFDAGNTLLFINPESVLPVFKDLNHPVSTEGFWNAESEARRQLTRVVREGSTGTEPEIWKEYFNTLFRSCGIPEEDLTEVGLRVRELHERDHLWSWVNPSTPPALKRLRGEGYRLGVISNADGRMEGRIRAGGIRDFFEFVLDSGREGVEKPDPEIFLRAARRMRLEPEEILYVGDLYPPDVGGARAAGMQAVLLDPWNSLDYPVPRIPDVAALPDYLARLSSQP